MEHRNHRLRHEAKAEKLRYRTLCAHEGDDRASASSSQRVSSNTETTKKNLMPSMRCCVGGSDDSGGSDGRGSAADEDGSGIEDEARFRTAASGSRSAEKEARDISWLAKQICSSPSTS